MNPTFYALATVATESTDSPLTNVVCTIFMTGVIAALLWWLNKTSNQSDTDKTTRKRR